MAELADDPRCRQIEHMFLSGAKLLVNYDTDQAIIWSGPPGRRAHHRVYPFKITDVHRWMSRHPGYRCRRMYLGQVRVYYVDMKAEMRYNTLQKGGEPDGRRREDNDTNACTCEAR